MTIASDDKPPVAEADPSALATAGALALQGVLALLFYAIVTPLGLLLRSTRIDLAGRRRDEHPGSYWRATRPALRRPPGRT